MKQSVFILISVSLLLVSCSVASTPEPTATTSTSIPTSTVSPQPMPTATPTFTPTSTWTPTPTDTPEPTDTPIPTDTPTPTIDPDPDYDGIPTWEEQIYGTDPSVLQDWSDFYFVSSVLNTPQRNSTYIMNHIQFIFDDASNPNYIATQTFQRGGGDCEDIAAFAVYNFRRAGISSSVLDVQWGDVENSPQGHAVAEYYADGSYWYIGTGTYDKGTIYGPFQDLTQVATHVHSSWVRWTRFSETFVLEERVYR